jgi:hypothetical protein
MERTAQCACGAVTIVARGDPSGVVACHCLACQRRTGSVLGVGAYFPEDRVVVSGETKLFVRPTDAGHSFSTHFCPGCGTSLYWSSGRNLGLVGIAVGAFADPSFPPPIRSVWEQSRHSWLHVGTAEQHYPKGRVG